MNIVNPIVPFENLNEKGIIFCIENFKRGELTDFLNSWENMSDLDKFYTINILVDLFDEGDKDLYDRFKWVKNNLEVFQRALQICYAFNILEAGVDSSDDYWSKTIEKEILEKILNLKNGKNKSLFYRNIEKLQKSINDLK
jgi:hypothetical protein